MKSITTVLVFAIVIIPLLSHAAGVPSGTSTSNQASGITGDGKAALTVKMGVQTYSDPINDARSPKAIPGAVMTYTVTVNSAPGAATAENATITDSLAAEINSGHIAFKMQYEDNTTRCSPGQGIAVDSGNGRGYECMTDAGDQDAADFGITRPQTVTVHGLIISGGSTVRVKFQIVIQ